MRLPRFEYFAPETVQEASALLATPGTRLAAGGTELLVKLKQGAITAERVVTLKCVPDLNGIRLGPDGGLIIGAMATLRSVATSPLVQERCALLATAAASVGRPRLPDMGTLGGNLCLDSRCFYHNQSSLWKQSVAPCYKDGGDRCHVVKASNRCNALFVADTAPALMALGAELTLASADDEVRMPLADFYSGTGEPANVLAQGQVLTQIVVPPMPEHSVGVYLRHSPREAIDFAVASVAVVLGLDPDGGSCSEARIVLGSVGPAPLRATEAEAALRSKFLDEAVVLSAATIAADEARPLGHLGSSASHKRTLVQALARRALSQAWQEANATTTDARGAS